VLALLMQLLVVAVAVMLMHGVHGALHHSQMGSKTVWARCGAFKNQLCLSPLSDGLFCLVTNSILSTALHRHPHHCVQSARTPAF
jgi:nitric oxide reductase large subunit